MVLEEYAALRNATIPMQTNPARRTVGQGEAVSTGAADLVESKEVPLMSLPAAKQAGITLAAARRTNIFSTRIADSFIAYARSGGNEQSHWAGRESYLSALIILRS
jgi:hypothetical protein